MWLLLIVNLAGKAAALVVGWSTPGAALALWFGPDLLLAYHLFAPNAQGLVRMHRRFATARREVWLTIDDGPDPEDTPQILALLATHGAHATFFVIGEKAAAHPHLINAITAAGHEVAHHTHTHPLGTFWCASPGRVARELDAGLAALRAAGVTPTRFRPPVGIKNPWLAAALRTRHLTGVAWSARGLEHWPGDAESVADRALRGLAPGAILLLHEGCGVPAPIRVGAIRRVVDRLHLRGYRCVVPGPEQLAG
ncbi:polysaccharide deacetylase family protein [Opitutus sp. GAS368]|uniref:polysaccharide deacetylase family protein n=1 Tax=Opitutus sp. GAS368 TaxID=1882749 RepID=UPI0008798854|nr:polysaccharide deacetylase family protein [Opitutus sp. GAS368]SDS13121.1 Peptidoglycan/xylan/chitin deacetylase, PgdA/CDA1 family [Opitutus sp. GAS368]